MTNQGNPEPSLNGNVLEGAETRTRPEMVKSHERGATITRRRLFEIKQLAFEEGFVPTSIVCELVDELRLMI
jgi:hypothetical protein